MFRSTISLLTILLLTGHLSAQSTWHMEFPDIISAGIAKVTEVIECPNGDILAVGGNGDTFDEPVAFVMKINPNGSLIWYKEYEGFHSFVSVINLPSGGFLAGGIENHYLPTSSILRADSMGNVLQAIHVESDVFGNATSLVRSDSGFIATAGFVWELNDSLTDINWISRLQPNGIAYDIFEAALQ